MKNRISVVALLLFLTGFCALIYQTVWLREFRLIFGGSTAASAAVLAIFMGGLGSGSLLLGRRADSRSNPLRFYGRIEILIALLAALSPMLLWGAGKAYIGVGGSMALGTGSGMILRMILAIMVLGGPTFLMGGTLPAAARAIETESDHGRRHLAFLYGLNTLGAVAGVAFSTFFLLERLGNQTTLWLACILNVLVGIAAIKLSKQSFFTSVAPQGHHKHEHRKKVETEPMAPRLLILVAAAAAGFAFLLMELVWYRMLGPLLGGSTFTFGLILAVALLGIGVGGLLYSMLRESRSASLYALSFTFALEAVCMAIPYALGDRVALLALLLQPLGVFGFSGRIVAWAAATFLIVFPAAVVSGFQFPLLIGLLGKGRKSVGRHTGLAYAWNTTGSIVGALAGGFGLLPLLSAPGAWKLVVVLLFTLSLLILFYSWKVERLFWRLPQPLLLSTGAFVMLLAAGPTAVWRQSPIGAGLLPVPVNMTPNRLRDWLNEPRRSLLMERDGIESCMGIFTHNGLAFIMNGKVDGNARGDASTQIMSGLLGALLHPDPKEALVIGLGTGSTGGWLGAVPGIDRVDVMELEPAVLDVAKLCAPVNQNVLTNPKVHVSIGDARELLLISRKKYDIIFSEPSNPYRAGVASLFTSEYYQSIRQRLNEGGRFVQWMQTYDVDAQAIQTVYATLRSVFPYVETWQTNSSDLLLIASSEPFVYDLPQIRSRITQSPYREALQWAWRVSDVEGVLAFHVANATFADALAEGYTDAVNTDDRNLLEFAFARSVGIGALSGFNLGNLRNLAKSQGNDRPTISGAGIDWNMVEDRRISTSNISGLRGSSDHVRTEAQRGRAEALTDYWQGRPTNALRTWRAHNLEPGDITERSMVAELLAEEGNEAAIPYLAELQKTHPAEAGLILGKLLIRMGRTAEAGEVLETAFRRSREDPWTLPEVLARSFKLAEEVANTDRKVGTRLYDAMKEPFAVYVANEHRLKGLIRLAQVIDGEAYSRYTLNAIESVEPNVPWNEDFLSLRYRCYFSLHSARSETARRDFERFQRNKQTELQLRPGSNPITLNGSNLH